MSKLPPKRKPSELKPAKRPGDEVVPVLGRSELDTAISELVTMFEAAKGRAWSAVNSEMVSLYWNVGKWLSSKMASAEWGDGTIRNIAARIAQTHPELSGFSRPGLYRMRQFYELYKDDEIVSPVVRQIAWTNHLVVMARTSSPDERRFYLCKCLEERWSKRQLERQIDSSFYERSMLGRAAPAAPLVPEPARAAVPDLYSVEFLGLTSGHAESTLRDAIVSHMRDFLLELGGDFTFVAKEYPVRVGDSDFHIDLLFFNRSLRCFFAFELKTRKFRPGDLGQLDFYLEALDRDVKKPDENPSVGVILCADKDDAVVEYALSRSLSPTLVSTYKIALPDKKLLAARLQRITEWLAEASEAEEGRRPKRISNPQTR